MILRFIASFILGLVLGFLYSYGRAEKKRKEKEEAEKRKNCPYEVDPKKINEGWW